RHGGGPQVSGLAGRVGVRLRRLRPRVRPPRRARHRARPDRARLGGGDELRQALRHRRAHRPERPAAPAAHRAQPGAAPPRRPREGRSRPRPHPEAVREGHDGDGPARLEGVTPGAQVDRVEVAVYRVPTDAPESDGTLAWDHTTAVVVHAFGAGAVGLGWTFADPAAASVVARVLAAEVAGRAILDTGAAWEAMLDAVRNIGR